MKIFILILILGIGMPVNLLLNAENTDDSLKITFTRKILEKVVSDVEKRIFKLPKNLLHTLIVMESNYNIHAINPKDAKRGVGVTSYGLGQITEDSARNHCAFTLEELYDPTKNIVCSAKIIKYQLLRYKHNISMAVAAYNVGTPCVCDGGAYTRKINKDVEVCYIYNKKIKKNEPVLCNTYEYGKFLNQEYVDKFFSLWKK